MHVRTPAADREEEHRRHCRVRANAEREEDVGKLEQMAKGGLGVDPEGLFKNAGMPSGGHFARRDAMKAAAAAPPPPVRQCRPKPRSFSPARGLATAA
jgi:hypothetical protein